MAERLGTFGRLFMLTAACMAMVAMTGCEKRHAEPEPEPVEEEVYVPDATSGSLTYTVAVIPKGTTHAFWKSVEAGALRAADEFDVEVIFKGPQLDDDHQSQIKLVEDFIARGVDGIVLAPLDDRALVNPVAQATLNNIPVVIIDTDLMSNDMISFVATDHEKAGYIAGRHLGELLGGEGSVVMLRYQQGSTSTERREEGFLRAMKEFPDIELLSTDQYAGATGETAFAASESLLAKYVEEDGSQVDGIFTPNEVSTSGMLRALQDAELAGKVRFVGFDASDTLLAALRGGELDGLVVQDPKNIGYMGVKTMVRHLQNKEIEQRVDSGATLITRDNIEDEEVVELLADP